MPDRGHTMMSIADPVYISDDQRSEILRETKEAVTLADLPAGYSITDTGSSPLMKSITDSMNKSQGQIRLLAGVLMVFALLLLFRHVKWPLLPIPVVLLDHLDLRRYGTAAITINHGLIFRLSAPDRHRNR